MNVTSVNLLLFECPHGTHDMPSHVSWYPPQYSNYRRWYPPAVLNTPRYSWYCPHASWFPPTVLKISPRGTHDIPSRYWTHIIQGVNCWTLSVKISKILNHLNARIFACKILSVQLQNSISQSAFVRFQLHSSQSLIKNGRNFKNWAKCFCFIVDQMVLTLIGTLGSSNSEMGWTRHYLCNFMTKGFATTHFVW